MDRFIVITGISSESYEWNLKSNMDRFIAICSSKIPTEDEYLKSNMDRFIASSHHTNITAKCI